jgi:hypothetical protein
MTPMKRLRRATRLAVPVVVAAVSGQLVRNGRAHGRLRITEDAAFCDSGILHWHAHT